jgi:DNA-binding transcriptional LysR family regulator
VTLIKRTTRSLQATPEGQTYFDLCRAALLQLDDAEAALSHSLDEPRGTLVLTAPAVLGRSALPRVIAGFREAYPSVKVRTIATDRKVDMVSEGIDLAIRVGPLPDSSMIARKLSDGQGGYYASREYLARHGTPATIEDLARHQTIGFTRDGNLTDQMRRGDEVVEVTLDAAILTDDFYMCRSFIAMGLGIGYLPSIMALGDDASPSLVRVLPDIGSVKTSVYLVYPQQRFVPARVKAFIDFATARMQAFMVDAEALA